jgi:hypothetical protein
MKHLLLALSLILALIMPDFVNAQMHVAVMSKCGGVDTVVIPNIIDNDHDGMDDRLEQKLLDKFMPLIIQFSDESCPGPALNGTGDSNLIACHIYPIPQQYTRSSSYDSILVHPVPVVGPRQLRAGLIWYNPIIKINTAVLYGQDCGLAGHTADVEGFNFSVKYTGPDSAAGWMYDTLMNRWMGGTIQSVSHAATACQQVETYPYKSALYPAGKDTIYASPDKHGNYLTISQCGASFICNPGCGNAQSVKHCRNINLGEPNATLVADLGTCYAGYAGSDPWTSANFLSAQGGNAGAIRDKMIMSLTSDFITGHTLTAAEICPLYSYCYGPDRYAFSAVSCSNETYTFHGRTLTQSGTYYDTLANRSGCDSVVSVALTIYPFDTVPLTGSICNGHSYNFNGTLLSTPGLYRDTLSTVHGCDSILLLRLGVNNSSSYAFSHHLCAGDVYNLNGQMLSTAGQYIDTITNVAGCDSIITLTLAIDTPVSVVWSSSTDTVLPHSNVLLLTATPAGGVYTGTGVSGNLFYPDSAAAGANVITYTYTDQYGCHSQASRTYYLVSTGVYELQLANAISLHPNPANDILIAESDLFNTDSKPLVFDITGHAVSVGSETLGNKIKLHISSLASGMYMVRFTIHGIQVTKKFVKAE